MIFGKWRKTPTWGPSWLNPIKALSLGAAFVLIFMTIQTPSDLELVWLLIASKFIIWDCCSLHRIHNF